MKKSKYRLINEIDLINLIIAILTSVKVDKGNFGWINFVLSLFLEYGNLESMNEELLDKEKITLSGKQKKQAKEDYRSNKDFFKLLRKN